MTIDKAIGNLSASAYGGMTTLDQHFKDACKLGIEALKWVKQTRKVTYEPAYPLLPGETK